LFDHYLGVDDFSEAKQRKIQIGLYKCMQFLSANWIRWDVRDMTKGKGIYSLKQ